MAKFSVLTSFAFLLIFAFVHGSSAKHDDAIGIYDLKRGNISVKLTNYGAHVISVFVPDKYGKIADVILGYDSINEYKKRHKTGYRVWPTTSDPEFPSGSASAYHNICNRQLSNVILTFGTLDKAKRILTAQLNDTSNFGATVGRVANRIAGAQFTLNGTRHKLVPNEGKNMLHGGPKGFSKVIWNVKKHEPEGHAPYIDFTYKSYDGEEGFPGEVHVIVRYQLLERNRLSIIMKAKALNKATPVNLANHAYWNLGGHNSGDILAEQIQIFGSHYTPVDSKLIPTGKIESVKGTPYDFLNPTTIGSKIQKLPNGYDMNYALDASGSKKLKKAAIVLDKKSGRVMKLYTNQPGLQFYTSNTLTQKGKGGFVYQPHAALCLETQGYPDAVNHPNFPSQIVTPGKPYKHYMLISFTTS